MAFPRQVMVDDTDSRIVYLGQGWFQDHGSLDKIGNWGPTYNHTSHGTKNNDSLSFSFEGTSITLLGSKQVKRIDNDTHWDLSWDCFVDQTHISSRDPSETGDENSWRFCTAENLPDGQHTFSAKIATTGATFWVDYFQFTPSPGASLGEAVLYVDNRDSAISLDSRWEATMGFANLTKVKGSQARFDFVGKGVTWMGIIPEDKPYSQASGSFSIDGGRSTQFTLNSSVGTSGLFNEPLFTTPELSPGPHSLMVTYEGGDAIAMPLILDYLYVIDTSIRQPSVSTTISSSPTTSTPVHEPPNNTTTSTSPASNPTNTQGQSPSARIGAIVGGAVGGLVLVALIFLLLWLHFCRHHRTTGSSSNQRSAGGAPSTVPIPFTSQYSSTSFTKSNSSSLPSHPSLHSNNGRSGASDHHPSNSDTINTASSGPGAHNQGTAGTTQLTVVHKSTVPTRTRPTARPIRHQDSGLRLPAAQWDSTVEDLPPLYTST